MPEQKSKLEALCAERGLKMTDQRRIIARVLSESSDHPDVEALHKRATAVDPNISIATVYRTVRLFEEAGILAKHDFGDGRARYEETPSEHHDHLIDIQSGKVVEFHNDEIEELQRISSCRPSFGAVWCSPDQQVRPSKMSGRNLCHLDNGNMIGAAPLRMTHAH
jgi:Fur family transcriptional regulator, ferric uptake regulator